MKALKVMLWVLAGMCFLSIPFIVMPWDTINALVQWFGIEPLPAVPVVMYMVRMYCALSVLAGAFLVLLAREPGRYIAIVQLLAYGLILLGVLALGLGWAMDLALVIFLSDGVFCIVFGGVLAAYARRVT